MKNSKRPDWLENTIAVAAPSLAEIARRRAQNSSDPRWQEVGLDIAILLDVVAQRPKATARLLRDAYDSVSE